MGRGKEALKKELLDLEPSDVVVSDGTHDASALALKIRRSQGLTSSSLVSGTIEVVE